MATYAIGDIQGCFQPFMRLLAKIDFCHKRDTLWLTGDLVNRGPQSLDVLTYVYQHRDSIVTVLGNHDLHLIAVSEGIITSESDDTLHHILDSPLRHKMIDWLRQQPLIYHDKQKNFILVHAGIPPQWSVAEAIDYAQEVESVLQGEHYLEFLRNLYGSEPRSWQTQLQGHDRLRYITNALTRMRFCDEKGQLNLQNKGTLEHPPKGFLPWFNIPNRKTKDDKILFGHWAALKKSWPALLPRHDIYPLDGGCIWGGSLCAIRLEDLQRFEVSC